MFTYTVYGVSHVQGASGNRWVTPVQQVPEIKPVSRGFQVSKAVNKQAEKAAIYESSRSSAEISRNALDQSYSRAVIRSSMDTLRFMGDSKFLLDMRKPAEVEPGYIEKYQEQLNTVRDKQEGEVRRETDVRTCDNAQQQDKSVSKTQQASTECAVPNAMGNAVAAILS